MRFGRARNIATALVLTWTATASAAPFYGAHAPLELNPLRFTNRAQCAADSKAAADSAFLVVDSYAAGKYAHNLGKASGRDANALSTEGMNRFRLTVSELLSRISRRLLDGELPLFPTDLVNAPHSREYVSLVRRFCDGREYCPQLDGYLDRLWKLSAAEGIRDLSHRRVIFHRSSREPFRCRQLKNFSNLQAPLFTGKPGQASLNRIAQDALQAGEIMQNCWKQELPSRSYVQLWEVQGVDPKQWALEGFDYWNSLRIWLSWAWRNLPQLPAAGPFGEAFRSLALEESVLFVPNGCKSIVPPSCDGAYLSLGALRELARKSSPDSIRELPRGPEDDLLRNPEPPVNTGDPAGIFEADTADAWAKEFHGRVVSNNLLLKNRLNDGLNNLSILSNYLPATEIARRVDEEARRAAADPARKNLLYYLCAEFDYAANRDFGILRDDLALPGKSRFLDGLQSNFSPSDLRVYQAYYATVALAVQGRCDRLDQQKYWDDPGFRLDRSGYAPWFKELIADADQSGPDLAATSATPSADPRGGSEIPLLSLKSREVSARNILCWNGVDCARKTLGSIVAIYSAFTYAEALLPLHTTVRGAPVFNPYAERTACQVYDPWFKTRSSVIELMVDLANTAAFGWNPIPAFVSVDIERGRVTSLKKLMEDGHLRFTVEKERDRRAWTGGVDFGSLVGVPCVVALTNGSNKMSPGTPYVFEGLSVGACRGGERHNLEVEGSNMANRTGPAGSGCVACYLSFASAGTAIASFSSNSFSPVKLGVYLFRTFARFYKSMVDNQNVPKSYTMDVDAITNTYLQHGSIPKKCLKWMLDGKGSCELDTCESRAREWLEKTYPGRRFRPVAMQKVNRNDRLVRVATDACSGELNVNVRATFGGDCELHDFFKITSLQPTGRCVGRFKAMSTR